MGSQAPTNALGCVSSVKIVNTGRERLHQVEFGPIDTRANDLFFDVAVVQFQDDGLWLDPTQIEAAVNCIRAARTSTQNINGALVITFIHGWHHRAHWNRTESLLASDPDGDEHFHSFRLILESLALREAERYLENGRPAGRRVVGVFLAWNGDLENSLVSNVPVLREFSFKNRYRTAERIGGSVQFQESIRRIIQATKGAIFEPNDPGESPMPDSPLVMIGHSMGALMLQSAFAALLEDHVRPLQPQSLTNSGPVALCSGENPVMLPDFVLSLNSAADSSVAGRIIAALDQRRLTKKAAAGGISYAPPLLISATSTADTDTSVLWRMAMLGKVTDGNDRQLFTHRFASTGRTVACIPRGTLDLGQNWHCLRRPQPSMSATPSIAIDLPGRERDGVDDKNVEHIRYELAPISATDKPHLMWVFQIPPEVVPDHNDIFNSRARELILALIKISGAVASLARDWADSFEPE